MLAELRLKHLLVWFSFLLYYIGLGLFYVFVGGLTAGENWYQRHSQRPHQPPSTALLSTAADERGCARVRCACACVRWEWVIAIIAVVVGCTYCAVGCMCSDVEKRQSQGIKADVEAAQM